MGLIHGTRYSWLINVFFKRCDSGSILQVSTIPPYHIISYHRKCYLFFLPHLEFLAHYLEYFFPCLRIGGKGGI